MISEKDLADRLYDVFCDGPRLRRQFGNEPHWYFSIDRIRGDRDGSDQMHQEPWLKVAREVIYLLEWAKDNPCTDILAPPQEELLPLLPRSESS